MSKGQQHLLSTGTLICANLLPIFGALFLHWNLYAILFLYWFENIIVGFYTLLRMALAQKSVPGNSLIARFAMMLFFLLHYGFFTFGHGVFLLAMLGINENTAFLLLRGVGGAAISLIISHGVSFVHEYLQTGAYLRATANDMMGRPYRRIILMHITIIFGAWIFTLVPSSFVLPVLLILLKTVFDAYLHLRTHQDEDKLLNSPS